LNLTNFIHEFQNDSHNYFRPFRPGGLRCTTWWQGKYARSFDPIQRTITKTNDFVTKKTSFDPTQKIWTIRLKNLFHLLIQNIKIQIKKFCKIFLLFVYFAIQGYVAEDKSFSSNH